MNRPAPDSLSAGHEYLASRNGLVRSSDTIVFQRSVGNSAIGETCWMPAFATITSSRPNFSSAAFTLGLVRLGVREVRLERDPRAVGIWLEVDTQDVHPVGRHALGDRAADSAGRPGHERGPALLPAGAQLGARLLAGEEATNDS